MLYNKREFVLGLVLLGGFFIVLVLLFLPLHGSGQNTIDYLDNVFNAISKNSAYYIPQLEKRSAGFADRVMTCQLPVRGAHERERLRSLLGAAQTGIAEHEQQLDATVDLGRLLAVALADADRLYHNDSAALQAKYGQEARRVGYDWHRLLTSCAKQFERQQHFAEAKLVLDVVTKAIEPAYNYYGVVALPMKESMGVVVAALVGYILYTIWYGFAILYLFEGLGLRLEH